MPDLPCVQGMSMWENSPPDWGLGDISVLSAGESLLWDQKANEQGSGPRVCEARQARRARESVS